MPVLNLENVSLRRNGRLILRDMSWAVRRGEHWALLGANGSGKTSLLKVITGYEWPTEGSVEVLGEVFGRCDVRALRKRVGWVSSALLQRVPTTDSVLDVVLSGLDASLGLYREFDDGEKALAGEILSLVHVGELAGQRYAWCSQGEQQRVLIARALVNRPDLLILDEPCAGLDPAARQGFLSDLRRLAARPEAPTMILVTHHIEEIGEWIEYVLMLKGGGVLACGEKEAVLTSETLSNALEHPCRVRRTEATYFVEPGPG